MYFSIGPFPRSTFYNRIANSATISNHLSLGIQPTFLLWIFISVLERITSVNKSYSDLWGYLCAWWSTILCPNFNFTATECEYLNDFKLSLTFPLYIYIKQIAEATNPDINMDHNKLTKGFFEACTEWNGLKRLHFAEVQQEDLTRCWRELISCLDEVRLTLFIQYDS